VGATAAGATAPRDPQVGHFLALHGLLDDVRLAQLLAGGAASVWEAAVAEGWVSDGQVATALAESLKLPLAGLDDLGEHLTALLPEAVCRRHHVCPVALDGDWLAVATANPFDLDTERVLGFVTGRDVTFAVASPAAIAQALDELYRPERSVQRLIDRLRPAYTAVIETETSDERRAREGDSALEAPISQLVELVVADAVHDGASDIHVEAMDGDFVVRYRIDGVLREVMRLPEKAGLAMVRRIKVLAKLDITDSLRPHDGRATARVGGEQVNLRISTIPVMRRGEKAVVRILDERTLRLTLGDLGMHPRALADLRALFGHREGLVVVTGPTGSGKTTTLYAALAELRTGQVNIVTVEDPVEYQLNGISQVQVNEAQGLGFAAALRSVLRQDPDIVLVGEVRDPETAGIAVQAGLTGHLVLTTLHTNDAASAAVRLRDLGVDGAKSASVLVGVVAQRLLRMLCAHCSTPMPVEELPAPAQPPADRRSTCAPRRAVGCEHCDGSGYRGRTLVPEVLTVTPALRRLISEERPAVELAAAARAEGMPSLHGSALERIWDGVTTYEEVVRVVGEPAVAAAPPGAPPAARPLQLVRDPVAPAPAAGPGAPARHCVLVADDDPQMRRFLRALLERDGYDVREAADGLDVLDAVEEGGVDLVLLDVEMPRLDGLATLGELRARVRTAALPVIVLTARGDSAETDAFALGADDYLTKPVNPKSLASRVGATLRRAHLAIA